MSISCGAKEMAATKIVMIMPVFACCLVLPCLNLHCTFGILCHLPGFCIHHFGKLVFSVTVDPAPRSALCSGKSNEGVASACNRSEDCPDLNLLMVPRVDSLSILSNHRSGFSRKKGPWKEWGK